MYKKIMEEKKFDINELYYEKEYSNLKKKKKNFTLIPINNNLTDITNILRSKNIQTDDLKEIIIHESIIYENKEKKRGYLDIIKDISFDCLRYFTK
jgi:cytochrome b involved in lipid metabolism